MRKKEALKAAPSAVPAKERLITYTVQKDGTWKLGYAVHISKKCPVVEAKPFFDASDYDFVTKLAVCKVCRHYKYGDWQNFPKVNIQTHILARLEDKFPKLKPDEEDAEEEADA